MNPALRKLALTAHVTTSVGWLGAVAAFLALALVGLASDDARLVRAAYLSMERTTWLVIVPLAFASLLTGLVVSLGTPWGLFRHYWVVAKLVITVLATILLLAHTQPIGALAAAARDTALPGADLGRLQFQIVGDALVALLALAANVTLSVFKPWGMTPYGQRHQREPRPVPLADALRPEAAVSLGSTTRTPRWVYVVGIHAIGLALLVLVVHLAWGGGWAH